MNRVKIGIIAGIAAALLTLTITFVGAGTTAGSGGETVLQVANLSCGACLKTIENELRKNKGMLGMTSDLAGGMITVRHTAELSSERLAELVTGAGYPAKVASVGKTASQTGAATTPGCRGCGPKGCNPPAPAPAKS